jgi:circadian clock protein KaiB
LVVTGSEDLPDRVGVALRLYVAADSAPSMLARRQLELVRERLGGEDWEVEVVDVFESPEVAEADGIIATPVLVRLYPAPRLSVIGDLGDWREVARILDLGERFDE